MCNVDKTGGRWTENESTRHINELETLAAFLEKKSFCSFMTNSHVNIYVDNTTAVAYPNSVGGTHPLGCNKIVHDIWIWCIARNLWV